MDLFRHIQLIFSRETSKGVFPTFHSQVREQSSGGHRRGATPVPIPNTAVKPSTGDGTNGAVRWESSKLPGLK